jgi:hypothetical protein
MACLCDDILHRPGRELRKGSAASLGICPSCGESTKPEQPTCGDAQCIAEEKSTDVERCTTMAALLGKKTQQPPRRGGVLARLAAGERSP